MTLCQRNCLIICQNEKKYTISIFFKLKILIVTQYFWPENFKINDLALELKNKGYEIDILTGIPNYPTGKIFDGYSQINIKDE